MVGVRSEPSRWFGDVPGNVDEETVEELSGKAEWIVEEGERLPS